MRYIKKRSQNHTMVLWLMILPAIVAVLIFHYWPMYGIQLAFRKYSFKAGLTGGEFVGLTYFKQFVTSYQFSRLMKNTFLLCLVNILFNFPLPILMALTFNQIRNKRAKSLMQTVSYMPHFISTVVMVSLLTVLFSPDVGVIGQRLKNSGLVSMNLLGSTQSFLWMYVLSDVWQHCGWNCIIYLAALSSVDTQLYDACRIDGANRFQVICYIDFPAIVPSVLILLILSMGNLLNTGFEKVYLMQNSMNLSVSEVISTHVYKVGMESNQFSYAAAVGLFSTLINFVFLMVTNMLSRRFSETSLW